MRGVVRSIAGIFSPIATAALLPFIGGIMAIAVATFAFAISALLVVPIRRPAPAPADEAKRHSLWVDSLYGFRCIFAGPSLTDLLVLFTRQQPDPHSSRSRCCPR